MTWACPNDCGLTGGCNACRPSIQPHVPTAPQGVPIVVVTANNAVSDGDLPLAYTALLRERDDLARRVDQLWRQRAGLVRLLASIKRNGGCSERHWRLIDGVLQSARRSTARVTVAQADVLQKSRRRGQ